MSLAAEACAGSQCEPTCALGCTISPQELGELSQFPFLQHVRFCRVCNVAIILMEMGEISGFPLQEIVKTSAGSQRESECGADINLGCTGAEKKE